MYRECVRGQCQGAYDDVNCAHSVCVSNSKSDKPSDLGSKLMICLKQAFEYYEPCDQLAAAFNTVDKDGNGEIDFGEFSSALNKNGMKAPEAEMKKAFDQIDKNKNGVIEFQDLQAFVTEAKAKAGAEAKSMNRNANAISVQTRWFHSLLGKIRGLF